MNLLTQNKERLFYFYSLIALFLYTNFHPAIAQEQNDTNDLKKATADSLYRKGKASKAFSLYQEIIDSQVVREEWESAVISTIELAQMLAGASKYSQANEQLQKAQVLAENKLSDNLNLLGAILDEKGGIFQANQQLDSAIYYYRKSLRLQIAANGEFHENTAACYNNIAGIHFFREQLDSCIFYVKKAIAISKEIPLDRDKYLAKYYGNLSILYRKLYNYDSAFHYSEYRIEAYKRIFGDDQMELVSAYTNHGQFYADLGDFRSALKYYHLALEIQNLYPELEKERLADNLNNIGIVNQRLGYHELAVEFYNQALTIQKEIFSGKNTSFGITYYNLSKYWSNRQDYEKSIRYAKLSIDHLKASLGDNHPFVVKGISNLAIQYSKRNEYDSAGYYYQIAGAIQKTASLSLHDNDAILAANRSEFFFQLDSLEKGHELKNQSIAIYSQLYGPKHPDIARGFYSGAKVYFQEQQLNAALQEVQKSLIANSTNFHSENWQVNPQAEDWLDQYRFITSLLLKSKILYALYQKSGNTRYLEKCFESVYLADKIIYSVVDNHVDIRDKLKLSDTAEELYEFAIKISLERYLTEDDLEWLSMAHEFIDKSKAFVLSFSLRDRRAQKFSKIPQNILEKEEKLQIYKSYYQSGVLAEQYALERDSGKLLTYQSKLFDVSRSLDSLILVMETKYPDYYRLKYNHSIITLEQLQKRLQLNEAVLNYFLGSKELILMVITSESVAHHVFPITSDLTETIDGILNKLNKPQYYHTYDASESLDFYKNYVEPGISKLSSNINKLIVIPHKSIGLIPFDVLPFKKVANKNFAKACLINQYTFSYGLSTTLLFSENSLDKEIKTNYLGFAPSYETNETEVSQHKYNRGNFPTLKWNQFESNQIGKLLNGQSIVGTAATEKVFKEHSNESGILHLAMHTDISNEDPMNSCLVFNQSDDTEDGFLHVFELYNMQLNADLAVLSACETGKGTLVNGEGIVSLARGFSYAGVPSIVMSHWQTNDESTSKLMQLFYKNLADGQPKDEALRNAKLDFLQNANNTFSHPFYWGGFVVLGNTEPINFHRSNEKIYFLILGLVILLFTAFFLLRKRSLKPKTDVLS